MRYDCAAQVDERSAVKAGVTAEDAGVSLNADSALAQVSLPLPHARCSLFCHQTLRSGTYGVHVPDTSTGSLNSYLFFAIYICHGLTSCEESKVRHGILPPAFGDAPRSIPVMLAINSWAHAGVS